MASFKILFRIDIFNKDCIKASFFINMNQFNPSLMYLIYFVVNERLPHIKIKEK